MHTTKHSPETIQKMREANLSGAYGFKKGEHRSPATQFKKGQAAPRKGVALTDETKRKISEAKKGQIPWNKGLGTISSANELVRKSKSTRDWRKAVFERDDFTCQVCGIRGGVLHADHIKQFAYFTELRFDINNGRTLCIDCHRATPTWGLKLSSKSLKGG